MSTDLAVAVLAPEQVLAGDVVRFTVVVTNQGDAPATAIKINDGMPAGLSFVGAQPPGSLSGAVYIWFIEDLAGGQSRTLFLTMSIPSGAGVGTTYANQVGVICAESESNVNNNSASGTSTVVLPNLAVLLTGTSRVAPGGTMANQVTVSNTLQVPIAGGFVTHTVPSTLTLLAWSAGGAAVAPGAVRWPFGTIAAGGAAVFTVTAQVPAGAPGGAVISSVATAASSVPEASSADNTANTDALVLPEDVQVSIASTAIDVRPAQALNHTVTIANASNQAAESVVVTVTLGAPTSYVSDTSDSPANGFSRTVQAGSVVWRRAVLAPLSTYHVDLVALVPVTATGGQVVHTVLASAATGDAVSANNTATSAPIPIVRPNLWVQKTGPAQAGPGAVLEYTMHVGNTGGGASLGTRLTDTLPVSLTYVSAVPPAIQLDARTLIWNLGTMAVGGDDVVRLQVRLALASPAGALVNNQAVIGSLAPDEDVADNTGAAQTSVVLPDLWLVKSGPPVASPGATLEYTLDYGNGGPGTAAGVRVTDTLPEGQSFVSAQPPAAVFNGRTVVWNVDDLAAGGARELRLQARVAEASEIGITLTNRAVIAGLAADLNTADNAAAADTLVLAPDLWVYKTGPAEAAPGAVLTYTLSFGNKGSGTGAGVRLTDTLPDSVAFLDAQPAATQVNGHALSWELGSLSPGAIDEIRVRVQLTDTAVAGITFTNRAGIGGVTGDAGPADNTAAADVMGIPGQPATATLTVPSVLAAGGGGGPGQGPVTVHVADSAGNAVKDETVVLISTTQGGLGPSQVPTVSLLTEGGQVSSTLTSGPQTGTALVTAAIGEISVTQATFISAGAPAAMVLTASPLTVAVGTVVHLTAEVRDRQANLVPDGTPVLLTTDAGTLVPSSATTAGGNATADWYSSLAGTGTVTATSGTVSATKQVRFLPGTPTHLELTAEPQVMAVGEGTATLRARLLDAFDNSTGDGLVVSFAAAGGQILPASVPISKGVAVAEFRAGNASGEFSQTAQTAGFTGKVPVLLQPSNLSLTTDLRGPRGRTLDTESFPGESVTYTLVAKNAGPATARNVQLGTLLPMAITGTHLASSTLPVTETANLKPELLSDPDKDQYTRGWNLPSLAANDQLTLTVVGRFDEGFPWTGFDTLFLQAALTTTTSELTPADMYRTNTARVFGADLYVGLSVEGANSSFRPGGFLVYNITVGNLQPQTDVYGARVTVTLPVGLIYDHWEPLVGANLHELSGFSAAAHQLVWEVVGSLNNTQNVRLMVKIAPDAPSSSVLQTAIAVGAKDVFDVNLENDRTTADVFLGGVNLAVAFEGADSAVAGDTVRLRIHLRNDAQRDGANNIVLHAAPPAGLAVVETVPPATRETDGRLRWVAESLTAGSELHFDLTLHVPETATLGASYPISADVTSTEPDSYQGDNRATWVINVVPGQPDRLVLAVSSRDLMACGQAQSILTATVTDRAGQAVADGTLVRWATTAGRFAITGTVPITVPPAVSATATAAGLARIQLIAANIPGQAVVTASAGPLTASVHASTTVNMLAGPPVVLAMSANPEEVPWRGRTAIAVTGVDTCGHAIADGTRLELAAERGRFVGAAGTGLTVTLPTSGGTVRADLDVGDVPGALRVTAVYTGTGASGGVGGGPVQGAVTVRVGERPAISPTPTRPGPQPTATPGTPGTPGTPRTPGTPGTRPYRIYCPSVRQVRIRPVR